jgi:hypothetical protein
VSCQLNRPVPAMTKLEIEIELPAPGEATVHAEGIVLRCDVDPNDHDTFKAAILFTKLSPEDHDAVERFVSHDAQDAD